MKSSSKDSSQDKPRLNQPQELTGDGQTMLRKEGDAAYNILAGCNAAAGLLMPDGRLLEFNEDFGKYFQIKGTAQNLLDYLSPADRALLSRKFLLAHHHRKGFRIKVKPNQPNFTHSKEWLVRVEDSALLLEELISRPEHPEQNKEQEELKRFFAVEQIPLPVMLYDSDASLFYANNYFLQLSGLSLPAIKGTKLDNLFPNQSAELKKLLQTSGTVGDKETTSVALRLKVAGREELWVECSSGKSPVQACGMLILRDISHLKEQEKMLQTSQSEMEVFMDRVFHDLKGPLNSLMALNAIVEYEFGKDKNVMEYFNHYHKGITRLHRILQDLLLISRIGKMEPSYSSVSLQEMVEECLQSFSHLPTFYHIRFVKEITLTDTIYIDESLLRTIVQNLLENAIKYSCENNPEVRIIAGREGSGVRLEVSDNGIGISKEGQARVFERFFRATDKASGSGLGLYLLKQAIDRLHGTVSLQSSEGEGTTFSVFIPDRQISS